MIRNTEFGLKEEFYFAKIFPFAVVLVVDVGFCHGCYSILFTTVCPLLRILPGMQWVLISVY